MDQGPREFEIRVSPLDTDLVVKDEDGEIVGWAADWESMTQLIYFVTNFRSDGNQELN